MATTNLQDVVNAKERAAGLKEVYYRALQQYLSSAKEQEWESETTRNALFRVQSTGASYFNFYEEFVGNSSLLGAHHDTTWYQGFGEDCFAVLQVMPDHFALINAGFEKMGLEISSAPVATAYANMQRLCKRTINKELISQLKEKFSRNDLPVYGFLHKENVRLNLDTKSWIAAVFFAFFTVVLIGLAVVISNPTAFQLFVFRLVAALAAASAGVILSGFIEIQFGKWLRAGGSFALFAIVYFLNPAKLVDDQNNRIPPDRPPIEQTGDTRSAKR